MYAKRAFLIAFLVIAVWSRAIPAGAFELKPGQVRKSSLSPGQTQSFVVSLGEGDFAQIGVNPRGQAFVIKTYDPSGQPFRGAELGPEEDKLNLVAEAPGAYRVEVAAKDKRASATYTIALEKVVTLAARLAPLKPVVESQRIQALRASVERGERDSVNSFWEEVKRPARRSLSRLPAIPKTWRSASFGRARPIHTMSWCSGFRTSALHPTSS